MALEVGSRLGHYQVTALIGEGGMGQVYRATDTRLGRDVALKILPDAFAADPDRLARFQREAQVLASLNHPNIAQIHGIEKSDDTQALVLELVEGPTLADRIAKGPIPLDEALPIAKQIAEALEAAHEAGVIHRDLKPANIKVREDGTVKVLDFGLAKALDTTLEGDPSQSPTLTAAATQMGVIMGTAAYMSPEQARGKPVDKRADIWAFGAVFYEMLTGSRPFRGEEVASTLSAVLQREPDWDALPSGCPIMVRTYIERCLDKDARQRTRDVGDVRLALEGAFDSAELPSSNGAGRWAGHRHALVAGALSALVVGSVVTGFAIWTLTPGQGVIVRFTVLPSDQALADIPRTKALAFSPDGRHLAFEGLRTGTEEPIYLRSIDEHDARPITGSEGGRAPFFSLDGQWLGFVDTVGETRLRRVPITGGPAVTIADGLPRLYGGVWGADEYIVLGSLDGLLRLPADGGTPERLTHTEGQGIHSYPSLIANRRAVLFVIREAGQNTVAQQVAHLDLDTRTVTPLGIEGTNPTYAATGHLLYVGPERALQAVTFDPDSLRVSGRPVTLIEGLVADPGFGPAQISVSDTGSLAYMTDTPGSAVSAVVLVDRVGQATPMIEAPSMCCYPSLSPDGTRVAWVSRGRDIWIRDVRRGLDTRFTDSGFNTWPTWMPPDGSLLTFASDRSSWLDLYIQRTDLSSPAELLVDTPEVLAPGSWSPDGQALVYHDVNVATRRDLWVLRPNEPSFPFLSTEYNEFAPRVAPNGRWVAYVSDQSGENRVFAQPFPEGGRVIPVSAGPGTEAVWSRDGREIFYRDGQQMMVVAVESVATLTLGRPRRLFTGQYMRDPAGLGMPNYDVSLDGQGFIMVSSEPIRQSDADARFEIKVVLEWHRELLARVPLD